MSNVKPTMSTTSRKATLRSDPNWLDALDLDLPRDPAPRENAAVAWSAELDAAGVSSDAAGLQILALRRAITVRPLELAGRPAPTTTRAYDCGPAQRDSVLWPLCSVAFILFSVILAVACAVR